MGSQLSQGSLGAALWRVHERECVPVRLAWGTSLRSPDPRPQDIWAPLAPALLTRRAGTPTLPSGLLWLRGSR